MRRLWLLFAQTVTVLVERRVKHALYGVHPRGHAAEVLQLVKGLVKCR